MKKTYKVIFEFDPEIEKDKLNFLIENCVEVEEIKAKRTNQQNRALWKYFNLLANLLNEKHIDMRTLIRQEIEIEWTDYTVKEYLWKPLQLVLFGKKSTTKLLKIGEIDKIYDNLNKIIIERTNGEICVPFPSIDNLRELEILKEKKY